MHALIENSGQFKLKLETVTEAILNIFVLQVVNDLAQTVNSLNQWKPENIQADSSSRFVRFFLSNSSYIIFPSSYEMKLKNLYVCVCELRPKFVQLAAYSFCSLFIFKVLLSPLKLDRTFLPSNFLLTRSKILPHFHSYLLQSW